MEIECRVCVPWLVTSQDSVWAPSRMVGSVGGMVAPSRPRFETHTSTASCDQAAGAEAATARTAAAHFSDEPSIVPPIQIRDFTIDRPLLDSFLPGPEALLAVSAVLTSSKTRPGDRKKGFQRRVNQ